MNPSTVIRTMRTILRDQCTYSYKDVLRFIFDERCLLRVSQWPAFCIQLTRLGSEYIREYEEV